MKRFILAAVMAVFSWPVWAGNVTMDGPMTDANAAVGVASTMTYTLNLDEHNIDYVSVQTVYSSGIYTTATFNDGRASTMSLTVGSGYATLSTAAATGNLTMVSTAAAAGTVGTGVVLFGTNNGNANVLITGPPGGLNYTIGGNVALGAAASNTATNFATAVNLSSNTSMVTASATNAAVTLTCMNTGVFCNSYAVTSSSKTQVSTAAFSGGVNPVLVTVGSYVFKAGQEFQVGASTAAMATNLAGAINTAMSAVVTASATSPCPGCGVVYATAAATGSSGNYALGSSNVLAITTSGVTMSGGFDNAYFTINGTSLYANKNWYPATSVAATCTSIYQAINSSFTGVIVSSCVGATGVVTATTTAVGTASQYATFVQSTGALTLSPWTSSTTVSATGTMYGGTNSSFTINGTTIQIPNHGFPKGLAVWLSSAAGTQMLYYSSGTTGATANQFTNGTTYYIIPAGVNAVQISTLNFNGVMSPAVTITSSGSNTTTDTYTLNTVATGGTGNFGYWIGDNGSNYVQVQSTFTGTFVYPSSSTFSDLGNLNWKWLQLRVVPPPTGAMPMTATVHGEQR